MNDQGLCAVTDCYLPNRHTQTCTTDCTGCLPGLAADTLRICRWHHDRAKHHLEDLPRLDRDLTTALATRTTMIRAYTTGTTQLGIHLDEHIMEATEYLRGRLTNLAAYVVTERGTAVPELTVHGLTRFLLRHAEWLSADKLAAPTWPRQVENIHNTAHRAAYRTRRTAIKLGDCPHTKPDGTPCRTPIRYDPSEYAGTGTITCDGCGTTTTVDGWQTTLIGTDARVNAAAAATILASRYGRPIPESTIRAWATKGHVTRYRINGRTLYDLVELTGHADTVWKATA